MIISSSYNSDEVNCRPASVEAGIEEYVVGSDVDDHSDPDSNDSNDNESLEVELLGRPVEAAKLLNRPDPCGWLERRCHLFFPCYPEKDEKPNHPAGKTMSHQRLF